MVDARGFACPMPVLMVQKAVKKDSPAELEVLVDNKTAVENVTRFASNAGYTVTYEAVGSDFSVKLTK
ncbi:MAG: sulfurtransferase TusA family protein [Oscillospiraceae bacterium]|nr:sulfurtransferase TusA family protein [Oscillospiraceae bacterium]